MSKSLTNQAQEELLKTADEQSKLMILCQMDGSCRVTEMLNLRVKNFDLRKNILTIQSLKKKEGQQKSRQVPITERLKKHYLNYSSGKGLEPKDLLFPSPKKGNEGLPLSRFAWHKRLKRMEEENEFLANENLHSHKLRHSMATNFMKNGGDLQGAKQLLGHEKLQTTTIYAKHGIEELREKMEVKKKIGVWGKLKNFFAPESKKTIRFIEHEENFMIGRNSEAKQLAENIAKNINTLIVGDIGVGKSLLLENVAKKFSNVLYLDDTKGIKKSIEGILLHLLEKQQKDDVQFYGDDSGEEFQNITEGSKADLKTLIYGNSENQQLQNKITRDSVINLCKILVSISEKHEFVICVNDSDGITPTAVKCLEILADHFTVITSTRKIAMRNTSFIWNFEKIELKELNRNDTLKMVGRLAGKLPVEDFTFLKNKIWETSNGNPKMIRDLIIRIGKEEKINRFTITEAVGNYTGRELKQIDMSIFFMLILGGLAIFRYVGKENGEGGMTFIGGAVMIILIFARTFFNGFKRKFV